MIKSTHYSNILITVDLLPCQLQHHTEKDETCQWISSADFKSAFFMEALQTEGPKIKSL